MENVLKLISWVHENRAAALEVFKAEFTEASSVDLLHTGRDQANFYVQSADFNTVYFTLSDYVGYGADVHGITREQFHNRHCWYSADEAKPTITVNPGSNNVIALNVDTLAFLSDDSVQPVDKLKQLVQHVADKFRKPVAPGCVKAFLGLSELLWLSKRASNTAEVIQSSSTGKYYVREYVQNNVVRIYADRSHTNYREVFYASDSDLNGAIAHRGRYYEPGLFTNVYTSYNEGADRLGFLHSRQFHEECETRFRSYTRPNGERVFTVEALPYADYRSKALWNYTKRIEELLPKEDLFKLGKNDLYSRRDVSEVPFLGWELEACCNTSTVPFDDTVAAMRDALFANVMCKQDGSISPKGFETVSVPATLDHWKSVALADAMNKMRAAPYNMRSYEHASCGFHVHVSRSALSVLDLQKIERFMHNPDNRDFLVKIAGRGSNTYAAYDDKLFNDRKSIINNSPRSSVELNPAYYHRDVLQDFLTSYITPERAFCSWIYANVPLGQLYIPDNVSESVELGRARHLVLTPEQKQEMLSLLAQRGLSSVRYSKAIKAAFEFFLPSFDLTPYLPEGSADANVSWKAGRLKTTLPVGRKNSYNAALRSKGPVGKGAQRYDVLNTKNQNTVEFRLFKGTMNPDSIYRYLEFVDALVRFVPTASACDDGLTFQKFIDFVKNDSFNRMRYETLLAFLIANDFVKRGDIRRREIKEVVENEPEAPNVVPSEPDEDEEEDYYEEDDYDNESYTDGCDCEDCQRSRGEID